MSLASPYTVKSLFILDSAGKRIAAKHYTNISTKDQLQLEKNVFNKTSRANGDIILLDGMIIVYRGAADVLFYVAGDENENELLLSNVLNVLYDAISILLSVPSSAGQIDKRSLLENLDYILLCVDELLDGGVVLESEPQVIANKVLMKEVEGATDGPITEQSLPQVLSNARDQLISFIKT
eukprot:TRINITY_DN683_c0_g1_i1.p1 TRINITY_DN683_c0_g1~~TRINITY_DN683_c0_g1_i1.p1  ORF type:complete len:202 (-),score=64.60 TRINITY_DN683_c0_g1_i1:167-709(-)